MQPGASDTVGIRVELADRRARNGIRVIAKRIGGLAEEFRETRNLGGRSRVLRAAPAFEDIVACDFRAANISCFSGDAEQELRAGIVGFEFIISDAPISDGMIFGQARRAILFDRSRI